MKPVTTTVVLSDTLQIWIEVLKQKQSEILRGEYNYLNSKERAEIENINSTESAIQYVYDNFIEPHIEPVSDMVIESIKYKKQTEQ